MIYNQIVALTAFAILAMFEDNGKDIENGKFENKELKYGGHVLVHRSVTDIS